MKIIMLMLTLSGCVPVLITVPPPDITISPDEFNETTIVRMSPKGAIVILLSIMDYQQD